MLKIWSLLVLLSLIDGQGVFSHAMRFAEPHLAYGKKGR
jgi:hypothetical protein